MGLILLTSGVGLWACQQGLLSFLGSLPAEEFTRDRGIRFNRYRVTTARLWEAEIRHENEHCKQVQQSLDQSGRLRGDER
ncbi:MAG: hypothetical protein JSW37_01760 [Anaerolineales bacterium]|nr:MAG: hypothetical protein JSW37_01760 [Anaerolineales bacterium]